MKKVTFFLAALLIGGMMFTSCKKDDPQPTPTPDPVSKTAKVVYKLATPLWCKQFRIASSTRFLI